MTTMITELYEALKEAGASEEKAKAAAEAILALQSLRLDRLEAIITTIQTDINALKVEVAAIKAEISLLKWMVGTIGIGVALTLARLFLFWPGPA